MARLAVDAPIAMAALALLLALAPLAMAARVADPPPERRPQVGISSFYGAWHHGRRMSNGKPFDMNAMTVAHRTIQLGAVVTVKNLANGRIVTATVTDRGPYREPRILDVSRGVARILGFEHAGLALVEVR